MKKIITSMGMLVFAGALIAGATGAFFSDTETSTGNVFTAGAIDLKVDSQQHYNNAVCVPNTSTEQNTTDYWWQLEAGAQLSASQYPVIGTPCDGTWELTDLGLTHQFFDFDDVKPGDSGEDTISLHIDSNPAWVCADVAITSNDDIDCTDPENEAEGAGVCNNSIPSATFDGELADNLEFVAWLDNATATSTVPGVPGDNIHQAGEVLFFSPGPASDVLDGGSLTLADGGTGNPLPGGSTSYIGLAWCAGDMTASQGTGQPTCDGTAMGNDAQTDEMVANITFRVEQARNNAGFRCDNGGEPVVTTLTLAKTVLPALLHPDSAYTLTATGPSVISGIEGAGTVTMAPVTPGVYTLSENDGGFPGAVATWLCVGNATPLVGNTVTVAPGEAVGCAVTNNYNVQ